MCDRGALQADLAPRLVDAVIELSRLPVSRPEKHRAFVGQRLQRIGLPHRVEDMPGMPPPQSVSLVLASELLKQLGLIPPEAARPASP